MPTWHEAPGHLAPGTRIYAIGDIHGCLDRLEALHARIEADMRDDPQPRTLLIHVGDYVDRGPDSAGVVARLADGRVPETTARIDLMGNHERMMLDALRGRTLRDAEHWLGNGGDATLASYGASHAGGQAAWRAAIPERHRIWLLQRDLSHAEGSYLFAHAGIDPTRAPDDQTEQALLWIREPFLSDDTPRDVVVVHGHTPSRTPVIRFNRIGIDTGAALGGELTCVVLEGRRLRFLSLA